MFLWKLLVCVVVCFAFAACDIGVLTEHGSEGIDPVEHHEGEDKMHGKRTIFENAGWAQHVKLQGKKKLLLGYSPVDFKYVPVVKPLGRRPGGFRFRPKYQKRPRPVYQGGWKPLVPAHVPVPPNIAGKPWQQGGWHGTKLVPSKPFRPSPVDHVHHEQHHNEVHTQIDSHHHHAGHVLVQDPHHHHQDGHVLVQEPHHHHQDGHVLVQDPHHHHHDGHVLVQDHHHHDGHVIVQDRHHHHQAGHVLVQDPHHHYHDGHVLVQDSLHHQHNGHVLVQDVHGLDAHHHVDPHHLLVQPTPVVHYDHPSLHVDKPALPVLPLGATFPSPVLQPAAHHHLIPQPTAVPVIPEPHGHYSPQYPGFYQVQVPQVGVTHLHPVPRPQVPHIDVPVPQVPLATHLHPVTPVHQLPIPGVNIAATQFHNFPQIPHFHQIPQFPQVHQIPEVHQVQQAHHVHQIAEVPQQYPQAHHVHQFPEVPLVQQFPQAHQIPEVHQIPQTHHFHQIPDVHQIPQAHHFHQIPDVHQISQAHHVHQIPDVHQIPQTHHVHQIPEVPLIPRLPHAHQTPDFQQIPEVHRQVPNTFAQIPSINQLPPFESPVHAPPSNQLPPVQTPEEPRFQHTPQIPQGSYLPAQEQQPNGQIAIEYHGKTAQSIPLEHLFKNIQVSAAYQPENAEYTQETDYEQSNQIFPSGNGLHPGYTDLQLPLHLPQHPNLVSTDPQTFPSGIVQPALALEPPYKR